MAIVNHQPAQTDNTKTLYTEIVMIAQLVVLCVQTISLARLVRLGLLH